MTSTNIISEICHKATQTSQLSNAEILALVNAHNEDDQLIFATANQIRMNNVGSDIHLRGLIEFSNICIRECQYCGLYCRNKKIKRYRMPIDDIIATAESAHKIGYQSIVLQSGEDPFYNANRLAEVISKIKSKLDIAITLSAGEFTYDEYKTLKQAGVNRYLLRFETSDPQLYRQLHPDSQLDERLECLKYLKALDFEVGTGFMVGLPNETPQIFANNLELLQKLDVDMIGIGPFVANPDTPLKEASSGTVQNGLKAVAITRMLMPTANIPATTAMGTLDPQGREKALNAGANVIMPNVSPMKFRELYQLYPGKMCITSDQGRIIAEQMIKDIGRTVAQTQGHSLKFRSKHG